VIEFKSNLYKIIKGFTDAAKMFNEIDVVVCWNVSEEDERAFKDISVSLSLKEKRPNNNLNICHS
jgi:hypothetical protein